MQIGDLVVQARRRNGIMGTIIRKHNEFYCNVLWVDGRREWIKTEMLEKAKPDKIFPTQAVPNRIYYKHNQRQGDNSWLI